MIDWLFETRLGIATLFAVVAAGIVAICFVAVAIDSSYREAHRDEWIDECRHRCARTGDRWAYNYRIGCTCGAWSP